MISSASSSLSENSSRHKEEAAAIARIPVDAETEGMKKESVHIFLSFLALIEGRGLCALHS